ncbi:hypothetical protein [Pseudogulbenkiania subflava]|uniref:Molecular chaperone DnaJ n=1 Tax=Pseudogulbenkiania subflava DSM 22618 TaxID=1123014 RepID=A0A1Y6BC67_9NEIS|nr:hypothetical protein [Pseudogulbenkiania subflava]SME96099.1 hypothetical protein SAMN02745746_00321 [Pseudogulbenkiania subflava DSM 22618]
MEMDELDRSHYTLHACAHCKGTGTCTSGPDGASCMVCAKRNELKKGLYHGLACGTCGGLGKTDTMTYRMTHRTQPILSISLVFGSIGLILLFGFAGSPYFHEVLTFCTTLLGSVIGYYFSKNPKQS